jgi:hypothetical protein
MSISLGCSGGGSDADASGGRASAGGSGGRAGQPSQAGEQQGGSGAQAGGGQGGKGETAGAPTMAGAAGTSTAGEGAGGADSSGATIRDCLDAPSLGSRTEAIHFESEGVSAAIVRRIDPEGFGTSGTLVWVAQRFGLVRGDVAACVSASGDLSYTISHHNFDDTMTASSSGQTWVWHQEGEYGQQGTFTLTGERDGQVQWGPVRLSVVSCKRLDDGSDCTARYRSAE